MPIVTDKKRFSFEFYYEYEGEDGRQITFPIKYLYGTYGPTIQIFFGQQNENGDQQGVELPADIFGEISNFLLQQGILAPTQAARPTPQTAGGKPMQVPLLKGAAQGIMATVQRQPQSNNPLIPQQSLSQNVNPLAPKTEISALNVPPADGEVPSLSNEEIMAARLAAKAKANANSANRFRKGHVEGGYDEPGVPISRRATLAANDTE